jgi:hypothetical protein
MMTFLLFESKCDDLSDHAQWWYPVRKIICKLKGSVAETNILSNTHVAESSKGRILSP